jgi:hypothetical protein
MEYVCIKTPEFRTLAQLIYQLDPQGWNLRAAVYWGRVKLSARHF